MKCIVPVCVLNKTVLMDNTSTKIPAHVPVKTEYVDTTKFSTPKLVIVNAKNKNVKET